MSKGALYFIFILLLSSFTIYLIVYYPSTADFYVTNPFWNGYEDLMSRTDAIPILTRDNFTLTIQQILSSSIQHDTILVTISYANYTLDEISLMEQYIRAGGTLVVLDDFSPYANYLLSRMGLNLYINNSGVLIDPLYYYKDIHLPRVRGKIENNSYNIVLNYASIINGSLNNSEVIIISSPFSYLDLDNSGTWDPSEPFGPFVVGVRVHVGNGILIIISDPSIWLNSMLGLEDNLLFARKLFDNKTVYIDQSHIPKPLQESLRERFIHIIGVLKDYGIIPFIIASIVFISYRFLWRAWIGGSRERLE